MKTLILTVGLSRNGKSTWARKQNLPIVNRDAIRLSLHGQTFVKNAESIVTAIEDYMVQSLFLAGHDSIIIDAYHISPKRRSRWEKLSEYKIKYLIFKTNAHECKERATINGQEDLIDVINHMSKEYDISSIIEDPFKIWEYASD